MAKKLGFTLIELLVVIAIIALLLSIIMPAMRKARSQAMRLVCANNIKQNNMALSVYATSNDGYLPLQSRGAWLHDVAYSTTDMIIELGGATKHTFYCPSTKKWDHGGNIGFLDGHVEWRQIEKMMRRNNWTPYHWW